jgi:Nitrogen fixation protein NifW
MAERELNDLDRAEDWFELLGVPYDRRVLDVYRLRLLKRFGLEKAEIDRAQPNASEVALHGLYAQALSRAHAQFAEWLRAEAPPGPEEAPLGSCATTSGCECG